jgi:hypothetical protein
LLCLRPGPEDKQAVRQQRIDQRQHHRMAQRHLSDDGQKRGGADVLTEHLAAR